MQEAEQLAREGAAIKYALHDGVGLVINLDRLAMMAIERGAAGRAATLMGGAENFPGISRHRRFRTISSPTRAICVNRSWQLGDVIITAAVDRGRALTPEQLIAYGVDQKTPTLLQPRAAVAEPPLTLTRREREIAALVAEGLATSRSPPSWSSRSELPSRTS